MKKNTILKLVLYCLCTVSAVVYFATLIHRFTVISLYGFDLTEYWVLAVFGTVFVITSGAYSFVRLIVLCVLSARDKKDRKNPLNLTLSANSEEFSNEGNDNAGSSAKRENGENEGKRKEKLTRAEKRKRKLLSDEGERSVRNSSALKYISLAVVSLCVVFCAYVSCWAAFPHRLCFKSYAYNITENGDEAEFKEIKNYRFYQSFIGKPYLVYSFDGVKEGYFDLKLVSVEKDDNCILYKFHGEKTYAKIADRLRKVFTYVVSEVEVYYYPEDGHISVNHHALKRRDGKEFSYDYSGKIYSYKKLNG
ncbi:MAG: hypothetical protein J6Z34_00795 [Clostridia bacterium]|nr:hypothetical protein [Clostridia bacterium]